MVQPVGSEAERKIIAILKVLNESSEALGSITIARELEHHGVFLSERGVRYHLRITDERGYTQAMGHDGRLLTPEGREELKIALAPEQVGFVLEKLDMLAFQTTFNPETRTGLLPINTSLISKKEFAKALAAMRDTFKAGICVSDLVATAEEGGRLGSVVVPKGHIGFATLCSVAINGVLLKAGIPTEYKFGGVMEVRNSKPRRFVAIINYDGTSLDPSEQFIRAKMTSVNKVACTGNGKILAVFRLIPAPSKAIVEEKMALLKEAGINPLYALGDTSDPVCQIPVGLNRIGVVQLGGLNPLAAAVEAGIEIENIAESGLIDYQELTNFRKL